MDSEDGSYVDASVGKCDRINSCGYHYPPKEFFAENPSASYQAAGIRTPLRQRIELRPGFDTIIHTVVQGTLGSYERNNFVIFLLRRFDAKKVAKAIDQYKVGTWRDGRTIFWQVDTFHKTRSGKLISYDPVSGKRNHDRGVSWAHAELGRSVPMPHSREKDFRLRQCYFGELLLALHPDQDISIVESEKTAVIMSILYPHVVWIASGGCSNLKLERISRLAGHRRIKLYPDGSKFAEWSDKAAKQNRITGNVSVSDFLEKRLSEEEKSQDMDIADVLMKHYPAKEA